MSNVYCGTVQINIQSHIHWSRNLNDLVLFKIKPSHYYDCITTLKTVLDKTELYRAERYHFEKDRNRFIICRALLKLILAKQMDTNVSDLKIGTEVNKKPYLISDNQVKFNLSHTDDLAIIALSNKDVGIDLEYQKQDFDFKEVLTHVYSNEEINTILKSENQRYTFYKFWTRKEAIVKAIGTGINEHLLMVPAIDGHHKVDSFIIYGIKNVCVLSFDLEQNHIASIAIDSEKLELEKLQVYTLPNTLHDLSFFTQLKKN
jgi:4'-phosphopantetheinyl transferase